MSAASVAPSTEKANPYRAILWGGLIAGALDITAAFINSAIHGSTPARVLQGIAGGLLGAKSFQYGLASAALGLALHFLVAYVATTVFYVASRKLTFLVRRPFLSGPLYGIAVYLFMYLVVLPLTFSRSFVTQFSAVLTGLLIHIVCVGLPIALTVRRFSAASLTLALLALFLLAPSMAADAEAAARPEQAPAATSAVLVELFTSEGCSTCPPADWLLADLDEKQPVEGAQIIALGEHVDYWNRLGWKDPFSSAEFSKRQLDYMQALKLKDVYTPQMIVDGRIEFVGSKVSKAYEMIAKAAHSPKAAVSLAAKLSAAKSLTLTVRVENLPEVSAGDTADLFLAITESHLLSDVTKGENSGRKLTHAAVTRKLVRIGSVSGKAFSAQKTLELDSAWNRSNLKAVAFVQERASRQVLGAAAINLAGEL
jgi:hypothetical protein